jgi:hypothetical protein
VSGNGHGAKGGSFQPGSPAPASWRAIALLGKSNPHPLISRCQQNTGGDSPPIYFRVGAFFVDVIRFLVGATVFC